MKLAARRNWQRARREKEKAGGSCRIVALASRVKPTSATSFSLSLSFFSLFREARWLDGCGSLPRLHLSDSRIGEFVAWRNCQTRRQPTQSTKPSQRNESKFNPLCSVAAARFNPRTRLRVSVVFCHFDALTGWRRASKPLRRALILLIRTMSFSSLDIWLSIGFIVEKSLIYILIKW